MCGIFGFVGDPDYAGSLDLSAALAAMRHRGPDDEGTFHDRSAGGGLSAAGHQPMTTADGRYTIAYNGEVFNFVELRKELESDGRVFRSHTDTEILLEAYAQWGPDCPQRLEGMFAFAVWDRLEGSLFLCRDRLGVKPLYYRVWDGGIAFASEVRTLLATGVAGRTLSAEGILTYLQFGSVADPYTILAEARSVRPGELLRFRDRRAESARYWRVPVADPSEHLSLEEAVEELRPRLWNAVGQQLVSDVPIGVFLSGGVDSSVVTGCAARQLSRPLHTFTVTFDEKAYSEERYAAEVAAHFGCDHHQIHLRAEKAASEFENALAAMDQPSSDGVNTYFVAKAAREAGLTVALSGLGGDEAFCGYLNFRNFSGYRMLGSVAASVPRAWRELALRAASAPGRTNRTRKLAALAAARGEGRATYAALRGMFTSSQIDGLLAPDALAFVRSAELVDELEDGLSDDPVNLYSRLELQNYLPNTLLRDTDAMSMAHALEVRVPLLAHRIIETLARVPGHLKLRRDVNKPLLDGLRSAARPMVSRPPL